MLFLIVLAIALAASLFRFTIADYSLWFDEQASMFFVQQPLGRLWSSWMVREPNPPLYYSLLKYWIDLFGDSERACRALSIAAGAGSIVTTAMFAGRIYGRNAGIVAAILTALSTQQLYYSLQVRSFELVYLASSGVLISLVSIDRCLRRGRARTGGLIVYALGCTIAIYLHTTMFLLPVICTLAIMVVRRREWAERPVLLLPLMAANLATALATAWWLDITLRQIRSGVENVAVFDAVTPWLVISKTVGTLFFVKSTGAISAPIYIVFVIIMITQVRKDRDNADTNLLLVILSLAIGLFCIISIKVPVFLPRTIFWLSIITTAFCAAGISRIGRAQARWLAMCGLGAVIALNMATAAGHRQTENWSDALSRAAAVPGSRLIVQSEAMGLLLTTACERRHHAACPIPIIAVTTPDDQLDRWASGQYKGQSIAIANIDALPQGQYFIFRKEFYHDLLQTLHLEGKASFIHDDPPLFGPINRSALIR